MHSIVRPLLAGALYFIVVFAVAFALGAIRVVLITPAVGVLLATLIELPFTLAAAWFTCRWIVRSQAIASGRACALMGATAFTLLMSAEVALATLVFGQELRDYFGAVFTLAGMLGLTGQVVFGLFPVIRLWRNLPHPATPRLP